ncbi:MAG: RidA family protein [Fibromonadaceae bacterium]|jgi:2-iminobutanoate/2-iminopropanoate deaminase|nr:RidA family protein [Fibromonadaceae bacterium]
MTRKEICSKDIAAVGPYSLGVNVDGLVFFSGQIPIDPKTGKLVEGDIKAQTEQVFSNIFNLLESAGLTSDNVQKVNVFLTDMNDFQDMNEVYKNKFNKPYPARSTLGVAALPLGSKVEIEIVAK